MHNKRKFWGLFIVLLILPRQVFAMHIMEGFLPPGWSLFWTVVTIPFAVAGFMAIKRISRRHSRAKLLLAMAGAFIFVLSALKLPSVTGSCSHPTGVGLGAILFGPLAMSILGLVVLLFQALLLAHGGLTTLGANAFSMAVAGPLVAYAVYRLLLKARAPRWLAVFFAVVAGNLLTYGITSLQLALAFPAAEGGVAASLARFLGIFALTQVPLAVSEGLMTVIVFNALLAYSREGLSGLELFAEEI